MKEVNGIDIKRVAVISDLSCFGKCSLTVAVPVISHFGIETVPLPTAVLSTHTGGFENYKFFSMSEHMDEIFSHWKELNLKFDGIYSGYLCGKRQIDFVRRFVSEFGRNDGFLMVDPIMADDGEMYSGFEKGFVPAIRELCKMADVITPNATEAALLADMNPDEVISSGKAHECLMKLCEICKGNVVITGIKKANGSIGYLGYEKEEKSETEVFYPEIDRILPGCGDIFASVFCAKITGGEKFHNALKYAADFTHKCILNTKSDKHWYGLEFEKILKEAD